MRKIRKFLKVVKMANTYQFQIYSPVKTRKIRKFLKVVKMEKIFQFQIYSSAKTRKMSKIRKFQSSFWKEGSEKVGRGGEERRWKRCRRCHSHRHCGRRQQTNSHVNSLHVVSSYSDLYTAVKMFYHVLLLKMQWLMLHFGPKRREVRGSNTKKRGKIFLGCKDKIYGKTNLHASFPITREDFENYKHLHCVEDVSSIPNKNPRLWVFHRTRKCKTPIAFTRKRGQVM